MKKSNKTFKILAVLFLIVSVLFYSILGKLKKSNAEMINNFHLQLKAYFNVEQFYSYFETYTGYNLRFNTSDTYKSKEINTSEWSVYPNGIDTEQVTCSYFRFKHQRSNTSISTPQYLYFDYKATFSSNYVQFAAYKIENDGYAYLQYSTLNKIVIGTAFMNNETNIYNFYINTFYPVNYIDYAFGLDSSNNYQIGYDEAFNSILSNPMSYGLRSKEQYDQAITDNYEAGYLDGYEEGYDLGSEGTNSYKGVMASVFTGLSDILEIEIFPNITIGLVIGLPILLGVFLIILKLIKG